MKLDAVLALHPGTDATSAAIGAAIGKAREAHLELVQRAYDADQRRAAGLLTDDDKTMRVAEKEAADARLAADRIEALLPTMRADFALAQGRETVAELRLVAAAYEHLRVQMEEWQAGAFQQVAELIGAGLALENRLMPLWVDLQARIANAYQHQGVRDTGARFDDVKPPSGHRPSDLFPTWGVPGRG